MKPRILLLDLDRTLFDTARFMPAMWQAIAAQYSLNYEHQMALVPHFYRAMGDYRYYDLKVHLQDLGMDAEEVIDKVTPVLQKQDFIFPDVSELKEWQKRPDYEIRVLTFGPEWVQSFKLRFAPEIAQLPLDMILEPKNEFIARTYPRQGGLLVDDKRNPQLPPSFKEVWLNRDHTMQNAQESGMICINSLNQVKDLL
jgi:phosphoglycolate phosphatase-like HAD superfamily hydrolase